MKLRNRKHLVVTDTEYGAVLLDTKSGEYWQLNPPGAVIVRTLLDGEGPDEAIRRVTGSFEVESDRAAADVHALIEAMRSAGVVEK
ncbi:lasso peptide biosynthesis PqqD family chaperone [Streptomyces sp. NPDC048142]|uniref:lasso peptide biosynthesis PqqD family chaperone n=1 Tax=Streptomyces sp. NPDC048142 TaxID=3365501 RepID=UPI00371DF519